MNQRARLSRTCAATGLVVALIAAPASVHAQADDEPGEGGSIAQRAADAGAFATWTMAPRSDGQKGLVHVTGVYDGARDGAQFESVLEAAIVDRVSLRAGGSYFGPEEKMR